MATDPYMGFEYPDVGEDVDSWGLILNQALEAVGAHSHIMGQGVPIPSAALAIDGDVLWASGGENYAIGSLKAIDFTPVPAASITGYSAALFANSTDGNNLYFRTQAGSNVRITNGATLDLTVTGGIVGDYQAIGAEAAYSDANKAYTFRQNGSNPKPWAVVSCGPVDIHEIGPYSGSNRVRLQSPAALASPYAITFPGALPGAAAAMQIASDGTLAFSSTFTGNLTAADFRFSGSRTLEIDPSMSFSVSAGPTIGVDGVILGTSTTYVVWPVTLPAGTTIVSWSIRATKTSASGTIAASLERNIDGTPTRIGSEQTNGANNPGLISLGQTVNHAMTAGGSYHVRTTGGGTMGDTLFRLTIVFTRP